MAMVAWGCMGLYNQINNLYVTVPRETNAHEL